MFEIGRGVARGLRVGIIGGSIAGCAMAIELSRAGCDVTVLERSGEELKERGAGIGMPPSVYEMLVGRDLIDAGTPGIRIRTAVRLCRTQEHERFGYVAWEQPANLVALNWGNLYRNLRLRVPEGAYRTRQQVVALDRPDAETVVVGLAGGRRLEFDLVVCADGYRSFGRQTLFPQSSVEYAGYVLWRGLLPEREIADAAPLEGVIVTPGYRGGHGIFIFVAGPDGSVEPGRRLVNWAIYLQVPQAEYAAFFTDAAGAFRDGTLAPNAIPIGTELSLKRLAREMLPDYYAEITNLSTGTFVHAVFDCLVPAYADGRICLTGDAAATARPHAASGALKAITNAVALGEALRRHDALDAALAEWDDEQTAAGNASVQLARQLGRAFVTESEDWSRWDGATMKQWFDSVITGRHEIFATEPRQAAAEPVSLAPQEGDQAA
ncbi:MAG TPA: FAD-dependent monooxygenase [Thermomicrobiales bacterium]|jgi:2-polyprenyl-6-methoxyphenol hydroxylase-like FAD-dependent oxidoreductase